MIRQTQRTADPTGVFSPARRFVDAPAPSTAGLILKGIALGCAVGAAAAVAQFVAELLR